MPKVHHVKKARKANKDYGIKKGESYYWWKFRRGGKRVSKSQPKPSQLTQSDFWCAIFGLQESYDAVPEIKDIESQRDGIVQELQDICDETQGKLDNMPDQLQEGDTGQLLQERIEACEEAISSIESVDTDPGFDDEDKVSDEKKQERAEEIWSEVTSALDLSCS